MQEDNPDVRYYCQVKEDGDLLDRYNDKNMEDNYSIEPSAGSRDNSAYAKLSDKYAVIYGMDGEIDSFFEIRQGVKGGNAGKKLTLTLPQNTGQVSSKGSEPGRLNLIEILERKGFSREKLERHKYLSMLGNYKALIELPFRAKIEDEFGISLSDYSVREQLQFVNFLSSRTVEEVEKVKGFLNKAENGNGKINRIKSFLSLEMDRDNGQRILEIGEKTDKKDAELVFAKIVELLDWAEREKEALNEELYENKDYEAMAATQKELLRRAHGDSVF
ncbi:hypothetical protein A2Y83_01565 [Candidatus Falkowbacteria bacterium RBG_13_39_14]|uniref:Uncharacterized protein n=1 Tax=Candidatus Falkowbacteria bacterium RBG_13_39_14 TaxID=1797985 RepID=A0A1F5S6R4_9BACT|nr:MAG: hypothetical protein A2Y83_01565 [Candidatus Falkowbacteria bacterium RBG_13_39_14]